MQASLADVEPFLNRTLSAAQRTKAEAWLRALSALVTARYGRRLTRYAEDNPDNPLDVIVHSIMAAAIDRRFDKPNRLIDSEGAGPFSVKYNSGAGLSGWFLADELAELDGALGVGGTRSYRTPAPDPIRFGNLYDVSVVPEDEVLEDIANDAVSGDPEGVIANG